MRLCRPGAVAGSADPPSVVVRVASVETRPAADAGGRFAEFVTREAADADP